MKKILEFLAEKNRWAIVLVIILLLIGGGIWKLQRNKINNLKDKYQSEVKLKNALIDSVGYYKNVYGEVVAEKLTLQTSIKDLEKINGNLTASQKELLIRIKAADKKNSIITAALIEAEALIDSLLGAGFVEVDPNDSTITFSDSTEFLIYDITIGKAVPAVSKIDPTIMFNRLKMPNKQFIEFHWKDDKKEGYPIEFSVSNSNKYFKTYNINSYAIPKLDKDILNPTGWQKVGRWFIKNGKVVGFVAGGVVIGAGGTYILMK
jgi:hypothetical protein